MNTADKWYPIIGQWPAIICGQCETTFSLAPATYRHRLKMSKHGMLFCGRKCVAKFKAECARRDIVQGKARPDVQVTCPTCYKVFTITMRVYLGRTRHRPPGSPLFCSNQCGGTARSQELREKKMKQGKGE